MNILCTLKNWLLGKTYVYEVQDELGRTERTFELADPLPPGFYSVRSYVVSPQRGGGPSEE